MTTSSTAFPLSGVIGIVDSSAQQLDLAVASELRCVEIRADLLRTAGLSDVELMALVSAAKAKGLACLFTLRHADQGGTFNSDENERVMVCMQALEAGADIIDLEHGTDACVRMSQESAPMILSYHNFKGMVDAAELASLTQAMEEQAPAAIKIIPTGRSMADAATMLSWVGNASRAIRRIGFTMGAEGGVSRILTLAHGAPVTYASFGEPVAPGQIDIAVLLSQYQCNTMSNDTNIIALVGDKEQVEAYRNEQSVSQQMTQANNVYIGFNTSERELLELHGKTMKINDIRVL